MKNMRKFIGLALTAAFGISSLTACGEVTSSPYTISESETETTASDAAETSETASDENGIDYFAHGIGALLEDGILVYGPAAIPVSGYTVYTPEEDDGYDYLVSEDVSNYFSILYQFEFLTSYEESDEEAMLESFANDGWTDVEMLYYEKFYLGEYPCIRYGAKGLIDGELTYASELIMINSTEDANKSMRIINIAYTEDGFNQGKAALNAVVLADNPAYFENRDFLVGNTRITVR